MKRLRNSAGFTLIELMITLALIGLVITGGISLYVFANRSFFSGAAIADVQADVQLAMKRITEEIRLAHSLEFMSEIDETTEHNKEHLLYEKEGSILLRTATSSQVILAGDPELTTYNLNFQRSKNENVDLEDVLHITISAENPKVDYSLDTEMQILNLRSQGIQGTAEVKGIRFTKDFSEGKYDQAEVIKPGCIYRHRIYIFGSEELDQLRHFRDTHLAKSPVGRFITRFYYAASPALINLFDRSVVINHTGQLVLRNLAEFVIRIS